MVVRRVQPSLGEALVLLAPGAALIAVCVIWTATHPAPVNLTTGPSRPGPLTAVWLGVAIALGVTLLGMATDGRRIRAGARTARPPPRGVALERHRFLGDVSGIAMFLVLTAATGFHPVAGALAGGLAAGVGLFKLTLRLYVGRLERDGGCLLGAGDALYRVPTGTALPAERERGSLWGRITNGRRIRLWSRRVAALVLALLAGLAAALVVMLLLTGGWHVLAPETAARTRPVAVAQVVEVVGLLVLLGGGSVFFWRLLRRFTGERIALGWLLAFVLIQAIPITLYASGGGRDRVGGRQGEELARDIEAMLSGRPRAVDYEIVLVLDRAGAEFRRLVDLAKEDPEKVEAAVRGMTPTNVSIQILTLEPMAGPDDPPLRYVLFAPSPPDVVADALQELTPRRGPPATGSIPAALRALADGPLDAVTGPRISLSGTLRRRAIVLPLDRLPSRGELESSGSSWDELRHGWPGPEVVVEAPGHASAEWRRWTSELHGRVQDPATYRAAPSFVQRAQAGVMGRPTDDVAELAFDYRPLLLFDTEENYGPLDVDQFLAQTDGRPAHQVCHRAALEADACRSVRSPQDLYTSGRDFDYLDFDGYRRHGSDVPPDLADESRQRIYYRASPDGERLHLQYWWFQRFNNSPLRLGILCFPGISIQETTCFDHEGDWEGVTVTVRRDGNGYRGERVTYTGHGWPHGYSYDWPTLAAVGSVQGSHPKVYVAYGSHAAYPVACAADCTQLDFRLHLLGWLPDWVPVWAVLVLLVAAALVMLFYRHRWIAGTLVVLGVAVVIAAPGIRVPDGHHDGEKDWAGNVDGWCDTHDCLVELPELRAGTPISWNAYPGEWGKAECTTFKGFCVRSAGPTGPAAKCRGKSPNCRYLRPDLHTPGSPRELTRAR